MNPREIARAMSIARIAIGMGLIGAPRLAAPLWVGSDGLSAAASLFCRAVGARDIALGAGTLTALRRREPVGRWLRAAMLADATDAVATYLERDEVPALSRPLVYAIGGGAVALGAAIQTSVDRQRN